jgi:signal peptidase I
MQQAMKWIAIAAMAMLAVFAVAWYANAVYGDFALVLMIVTAFTGVYWLAEKSVFLPARRNAAAQLKTQLEQRQQQLAVQGLRSDEVDVQAEQQKLLMQPWWLDWTAGLFPVLLVVFVLRSFVVEPFKIPSGSMVPTLRVGDLILVSKFHYGIRLPVANTVLIPNHKPQKGDVMVFRFPPDPRLDYIKRVVGVPGDKVTYVNKQLTVNGERLPREELGEFFDSDSMRYSQQYSEVLGGVKHQLLNDKNRPAYVNGPSEFPFKEQCIYNAQGFECTVPEGHYFMMGDNRDNSLDSRYWGFVPEKNIVGKAFFVWMNFSDLGRIGAFD